MAKNKNTTSYTADELREKITRGEDRTDWQMVDHITDAEIDADIADDSEDRAAEWDWTKAELVTPTTKEQISLRIDPDVLAFFKQDGRGYQTRINAVLRAYMNSHLKEPTPQ